MMNRGLRLRVLAETKVSTVITVDVRYFGDKNAKANKFRENILTVILECFCRGSIA